MQIATRETSERIAAEAERYLAAIETFRREGCEPSWRSEAAEPALASRSFRHSTEGRNRCSG